MPVPFSDALQTLSSINSTTGDTAQFRLALSDKAESNQPEWPSKGLRLAAETKHMAGALSLDLGNVPLPLAALKLPLNCSRQRNAGRQVQAGTEYDHTARRCSSQILKEGTDVGQSYDAREGTEEQEWQQPLTT